ncbi:hypothetical protein DAI22_06g200100 [Oryza sativa Japonica Group]|nr:hypothetical protein DAI22_06g200100 [Oryza sativa Japonica Group]
MLPSREFMLRSRFWSSFRKPSSDGMPPWKLLFDSCSLVREVMLAIQGDIEPMMPSDGRSMAITRRGALLLHVTPCQLQGNKDALFHEARTPVGPESCDLKQRRASRSVSVSSLMANGWKKRK